MVAQASPPAVALRERQAPAQLAGRIAWLTEAGITEAQIDVHPLELGPVSIRIELRGDEARVSFVAPRAETRQALRDSLPQLHALLNGQNLSLARVQVTAPSAPQRQQREHADGEPPPPARVSKRRYVVGLLDDYA